MAGTLSEHTLGSFQLSAQAGGGDTTVVTATESDASNSIAGASGGSVAPLSGISRGAVGIAHSRGGSVGLLLGEGRETTNWHGTLGSHQLGSSYISGRVGGGNAQRAEPSATSAPSTAQAIGGRIQSLIASVRSSVGTTVTEAGSLQTLSTDPQTGVGSGTVTGEGVPQTLDGSGLAVDPTTTVTGLGIPTLLSPTTKSEGTFTSVTSDGGFRLGSMEMGEWTLGQDRSKASLGTSTFSGQSVSEGIGGEVTLLDTSTQDATAFAEALSEATSAQLVASAFAEMDRGLKIGSFSLGETNTQLGENDKNLTTTTAYVKNPHPNPLTLGTFQLGVEEMLAPPPASTSMGLTSTEAIRYLPEWALGQPAEGQVLLETTIEEVREWDLMELTIRMETVDVEEHVRPLVDGTGKIDVVNRIDGGFDVVDWSGDNRIYLQAPTDRADIRPTVWWYLDDVEEESIGTGGALYEITFNLVPKEEKRGDSE